MSKIKIGWVVKRLEEGKHEQVDTYQSNIQLKEVFTRPAPVRLRKRKKVASGIEARLKL